MFFIFQPTINEPVDEITIWFNGGPGCSSLEGFFQENGNFLFQNRLSLFADFDKDDSSGRWEGPVRWKTRILGLI